MKKQIGALVLGASTFFACSETCTLEFCPESITISLKAPASYRATVRVAGGETVTVTCPRDVHTPDGPPNLTNCDSTKIALSNMRPALTIEQQEKVPPTVEVQIDDGPVQRVAMTGGVSGDTCLRCIGWSGEMK